MRDRGFTVIEILVAVAIFSIIFGGLTLAFMQQQRQFILTQENVDIDQTGRLTVDFLTSEIRNAGARQAKTYSVAFVNGGGSDCSATTDNGGTAESPPDCLRIYTWDIDKGRVDDDFPSVPGDVTIVSSTSTSFKIPLPPDWVPPLSDPAIVQSGNFVGFWSRTSLCSPQGQSCNANPESCVECGAIMRIGNIDGANNAEFEIDDLIEQNYTQGSIDTLSEFLDDFFVPKIASASSEMTLVTSKEFRINSANNELEMSLDNDSFQPIAGGLDSSGIVDMQFVLNLADSNGVITRIGVPDGTNSFTNFVDPTVMLTLPAGAPNIERVKDLRSLEMYLLIRSRLKPELISGNRIPVQTIPAMGDRLERNTNHSSLGDGFVYKIFSNTIYLRNLAREDLG